MARTRTKDLHLPKYVTVINGRYWYRPPEGELVNLGSAPDEEYKVWRFMLEIAVQPPPKQGATLHEQFERYKREVVPTLAPRTQKDYARHIAKLDIVFGHMRPEEVKPIHIGAFLDRPKGKVQANRQVAVFSAIYTKMVGRWFVVESNPCLKVQRNKTKRRTRYITDAEFAAMYSVCGPRVRIAMDLALLTGQRQGDLLALPFKNVSAEGIFFQQGKTGKKLCVAMSTALLEVIDRARKLAPVVDIGGYVIRTRRGTPFTSEGFRACWQRAMIRALKGRKRRGGKPRTEPVLRERFTFHDIRAKTVSDSANIQDAFERAGHTNMAMTRGTYDRATRMVKPLK